MCGGFYIGPHQQTAEELHDLLHWKTWGSLKFHLSD